MSDEPAQPLELAYCTLTAEQVSCTAFGSSLRVKYDHRRFTPMPIYGYDPADLAWVAKVIRTCWRSGSTGGRPNGRDPLRRPRRRTMNIVDDARPIPVQPILDYASPGLKKKLALPTQSILTSHVRDDSVIVSEYLDAKAGAITAMVFAAFVLVWLLYVVSIAKSTAAVIIPVWLLEFGVLIKVIHDTWRKTTLEVFGGRVILRFWAPLRRKTYEWPAAEVTSVTIFATDVVGTPLGAINILMRDTRQVRLFDGHEYDQLDWLGRQIRRVLAASASHEA